MKGIDIPGVGGFVLIFCILCLAGVLVNFKLTFFIGVIGILISIFGITTGNSYSSIGNSSMGGFNYDLGGIEGSYKSSISVGAGVYVFFVSMVLFCIATLRLLKSPSFYDVSYMQSGNITNEEPIIKTMNEGSVIENSNIGSTTQKFADLKKLYDEGFINEKEFEDKKTQLLNNF